MSDLLYKGKFAHELTKEEAIECALHFRDAHIEAMYWHAKGERRMEKMKMALTGEQIKILDWWLKNFPEHDTFQGDGEPVYHQWTEFKKTTDGYQRKG